MRIVNLTQHAATPEQVAAGVIEPQDKAAVAALLTFNTCPTIQVIWDRARKLAALASKSGCDAAMIGGAPYLMPALETCLMSAGVAQLYSFSERISQEQVQSDGSVRKVNIFRHTGWVGGDL